MAINYLINAPVSTDDFIDLLQRSTLGERRPVDDRNCMEGMITQATLTVSAWDDDILVGVARSLTDFHYACYLSDLAVCQEHQKQGIGQELLKLTEHQLEPTCKLILIAAPDANDYYPRQGFEHNPRCWVYTEPRQAEAEAEE